jgi:HEAT repeat protein
MVNFQEVDSATSRCADKILKKIQSDTLNNLLEQLKSPDKNTRTCVIRAIGKVASPLSVRPLVEHKAAIFPEDYDMSGTNITPEFIAKADESRTVLVAFRDMGEKALPELNKILMNKDEELKYRIQIPKIYDWIIDTSSIAVLRNIIIDSTDDTKIRLKSMESYYQVSNDKVLFESLLNDQNDEIKKKASEILEK